MLLIDAAVNDAIDLSREQVGFEHKVDGVLTSDELRYFMDNIAKGHIDHDPSVCGQSAIYVKAADEFKMLGANGKFSMTYWNAIADADSTEIKVPDGVDITPFALADQTGNGDGTTTIDELVAYRLKSALTCTDIPVVYEDGRDTGIQVKACALDLNSDDVRESDAALFRTSFMLGFQVMALSSAALSGIQDDACGTDRQEGFQIPVVPETLPQIDDPAPFSLPANPHVRWL
jgi:hypothetical protein